ncbi:DUF11 domain-containing protein [Clostridium botulinum]|nr:DUF11 domain-containing protein [Clostridium botulinum]
MSNYSTFGGNWYNTSDHTTRNETGRYFLAGAAGSAVIFTETMTVKTNTYYVFSDWVMNPVRVLGTIPSQLTIKVTGGSGQVLYQQSLLSIQPQTVLPIWNESSTLFNTGSNTSIKFEMLSTGAVGGGNDYIIDDLAIQEANVSTIMTSNKIVDKSFATIGDTLNYTVVLKNVGSSTIQNIIFSDTIPNGTSFISGTLKQDGVIVSGTSSASGSFTIDSTTTPNITGIINTNSNTVNTQINNANLGNIIKIVDKSFANCGDIIDYTIVVPNIGNVTAENIIFKDTIPNGTTFVTNSVTINGVVKNGENPSTGVTILNIAPGTTTTVQFTVKVQC